MAKNITSSIRLRSDSITNWILNRTKVLPLNELSIVKFDDGSVSFKLGSGNTYANTSFIKFQNLCVTSLSDGSNTFSLPSTSGTLSLTSQLDSKVDKVTGSSLVPDTKVSGYDTHVADTTIHVTSTDKSNWNNKVTQNTAITGATKCKITYDTKGLVTAGADLTATDIPSLAASKITSGTFDAARIPTLDQSKISGLSTALNNKVDKVSGKGLSTNDYTTEEKTKLAGLSNYDDSQVRALIQSLTAALQSEVAERNLMEQRLIAYVDEKTSNAIDNVLNASYGN